MAKRADFRPAAERIKALPKKRLARVEAEAAAILKAHHLAEIRKALDVTQTTLASRTGLKQGEVSRIERAPETVQLKTMDRYVRGLGGEMKIVAVFPDGTEAQVPISHGKPVRSRVSAEPSRAHKPGLRVKATD